MSNNYFDALRSEFKKNPWLARVTGPILRIVYTEEMDTFCLVDQEGNILTREEFKNLVIEGEKFYEVFSEQAIARSNDYRQNNSNGQKQVNKRKEFEDRKGILDQANNQCEFCDSKKKLHVHHKDFDKSNDAHDNAQVLCQKCHSKLHKEREARLRRELEDRRMAEIRRRDLEVEQKIRAAWVKNGRSLDEIGGQEFNEFFHNYTSEMG